MATVDGVKSFFTGMFAAQIADVFTNPVDVVKIRLQIQVRDPLKTKRLL